MYDIITLAKYISKERRQYNFSYTEKDIMFCKNCGKEIKEGAAFCANCGTPVKQTVPVAEPVAEEVKEEVVEVAPTPTEPVAQQPLEPVAEETIQTEEFYKPDFSEAKKKKLSFKKLVLPAIAVVLALTLVVLNFGTVLGFGIKMLGSDKAYLSYVQKQASKDAADSIGDIYANLLNNINKEQATSGNISFTLDKDVSNLLSSEYGFDIGDKLDWINDLKLVINSNLNGNKNLSEMKLNISNKDIVSLKTITDIKKGYLYLAIPELCKDYLKLDTGSSYDSEELLAMYDLLFEIKDSLPTQKQLEKLIKKYVNIAYKQIEDVSKESDTLSVGGIDQRCTVLEYKISEKDAVKICEAVLEASLEDKEIKKIIENIEEALGNSDAIDFDEDLYELFEDAVDDMLDELDDAETDSDNKIKITQYINNKHEIIGTKIKANAETIIYTATAQKGSEYASVLEIEDLKIKGNGTKKGDILNGTYKLLVDGNLLLKVKVSDYDENKAKQGYINGNFKFTLSDELIDELPNDISSIISILEPTIEVDCVSTKDTAKLSINLLKNNKKVLFGITIDGKYASSSKISTPSGAIDATDSEAVQGWINSINTEGIIKSLRDTSVPSELVDGLESILSLLPTYLSGGTYEEEYIGDYADGYYNEYFY